VRGLKLFFVAAVAVAAMALAGPALAQGSGEGPKVGGARLTRNTGGAAVQERAGTSALPFTGADLALFVVIGGAAIGAGMLIVRSRRVGASA
jgi:hypothetical protein